MAQLATTIVDQKPAVQAAAIDRSQLARMTFGDRSLERELLELFDRQAAMLLSRMRGCEAATAAALAHTLKGSALGIGAAAVAAAAEAIERAATASERNTAFDRLDGAIESARATIADMLAA